MKYDPNNVTWRDKSDITMIACMVEEGIENIEEKYSFFLKAEADPEMLDDETIESSLKSAEEDSAYIEVYHEQLNRWLKDSLTTIQENKVNRISQELEKYSALHQKYFELLKKLSEEIALNNVDIEDEELDLNKLTDELPDS